ncbi:C-GCAxxG-C-C family protein [Seleniivibrio sp.]|uniref:C-GCAxxG-C-C family protein n=1 Tax=Seleniivibrio sp. TaxID=2898801 RepID=UPI0025EA8A21|nr:C-GCAxxG-C-C family protein [Seleniivibrio sp.]MCD8552527.1 C-GCAxxG-C-C family protein [Seleniivibrio sp.]
MDAKISRRDILAKAALLGAGAFVGKFAVSSAEASDEEPLAKTWPWPYVKLDPAETAEIAYKQWYNLGCGGTVMFSIFDQLAKKVGEPYKSFPVESFAIFEGGIASWGTTCGSVNGASVVVSLIVGPPTWEDRTHTVVSDTFNWYSHANMPIYVPKDPQANKDSIEHTVSNSPLCHVSVSKWMKKADKALGSPERKDRCARVSASVAYKVVQYLNRIHDEKEIAEHPVWTGGKEVGTTAQYNCADCHGKNVPKAPGFVKK